MQNNVKPLENRHFFVFLHFCVHNHKTQNMLEQLRGKTEQEFKSYGASKKKNLSPDSKIRRRQIRKEAKGLLPQTYYNKGLKKPIKITNASIKEWLNQPHKHILEKNEMILNIKEVLEKSTYMGFKTHKGRKSHIFETQLCGDKTWIVVTEVMGRGLAIYSISDNEAILTDIEKPA